jgi:hypothetical protein
MAYMLKKFSLIVLLIVGVYIVVSGGHGAKVHPGTVPGIGVTDQHHGT